MKVKEILASNFQRNRPFFSLKRQSSIQKIWLMSASSVEVFKDKTLASTSQRAGLTC